MGYTFSSSEITRRAVFCATVSLGAMPALAQECRIGPPQHHKGPLVFIHYDQLELDASYDQVYYEPLIARVAQRLASNSEAVRARIGAPHRVAYGPTEMTIEMDALPASGAFRVYPWSG